MAHILVEGDLPFGLKLGKAPLSDGTDVDELRAMLKTVLRECSMENPNSRDQRDDGTDNPWHGETKSTPYVYDIPRLEKKLPPVITGQMSNEFHEINKLAVPVRSSETRVFLLQRVQLLPTMPTYVPEMGVATQTAMRMTTRQVATQRMMESFILEHDHYHTPEGVAHMSLMIEQVSGLFCARIAKRTWESLLDVGARRSMKEKPTDNASYIEYWKNERDFTFVAHKGTPGLLTGQIEMTQRLKNRGCTSTLMILPCNKGSFLANNPIVSTYSGHGPAGAALVMDESGSLSKGAGVRNVGGLPTMLAPSLFDGQETQFYSYRASRFGLYTVIDDTDDKDLKNISIYAQHTGNFEMIDLRNVTENAPGVLSLRDVPPATLATLLVNNAAFMSHYAQHREADFQEAAISAIIDEDNRVNPGANIGRLTPITADLLAMDWPPLSRAVMHVLASRNLGRAFGIADEVANAQERVAELKVLLNQPTKNVTSLDTDLFVFVPNLLEDYDNEEAMAERDAYTHFILTKLGMVFTAKQFTRALKIYLLNVFHTVITSPAVVMEAGERTAFAAVTRFDMAKSSDAGNKSLTFSLSCSHATVVQREEAIEVAQNFFLEGTIHGANASIITKKHADAYSGDHWSTLSPEDPCWYVFPVKKDANHERPFLNTRGVMPFDRDVETVQFSWPNFLLYHYGLHVTREDFRQDSIIEEDCVAQVNWFTTTIYSYRDGTPQETKPGNSPYGRFGECPGASLVRDRGTGLFPQAVC
jgi:hypothetical protein